MDSRAQGQTGKSFDLVVERGKIHKFAHATRSSNPQYFGETPISPATFLVTADFWMNEENYPFSEASGQILDRERILHGEQEFVFNGPPPRSGVRLKGSARIDKVYEKAGRRGGTMTFIEIVREFRDPQTGDLVVEARTTLIETSRAITP